MNTKTREALKELREWMVKHGAEIEIEDFSMFINVHVESIGFDGSIWQGDIEEILN